jgi:two-component system, cell cycle sensor histidine kinase and response regulator CckA
MSKQRHILLIDDNDFIVRSLSRTLKRLGYSVSTLTDGCGAIAFLEESRKNSRTVDLLITDLDMPLVSGCDLIAALSGPDSDLAVIVITGSADKCTITKLLERKNTCCIQKPFDTEALMRTINQILPPVRL